MDPTIDLREFDGFALRIVELDRGGTITLLGFEAPIVRRSSMIHSRFWACWFVTAAIIFIASAGIAADDAEPTADEIAAAKLAAAEADLADAIAEIKLMSDFLAAQKSFSFDAVLGFDSVQANGMKLEFGGIRKVSVRRPDRVRVEAKHRDGSGSTLFFDGKAISVDLPEAAAYVSVEKPGTIDEAIDYLVDDLGTPAPLSDLLHSGVLNEVIDRIDSGTVVGETTIAGTPCYHVAVRSEAADAQLWIADGDQPLLQRIVITYKTAEGSPQFWAQFSNWNLEAKTPDELFVYEPPEGAARIPIGAAVADAKAAQEGSK